MRFGLDLAVRPECDEPFGLLKVETSTADRRGDCAGMLAMPGEGKPESGEDSWGLSGNDNADWWDSLRITLFAGTGPSSSANEMVPPDGSFVCDEDQAPLMLAGSKEWLFS